MSRRIRWRFFEVVPKREIAQHLEKSVVARGSTHHVEVIVFSGHSQTFLTARGPLIISAPLTRKQVFELHHPSVREEQGRVVPRNQRRAADASMAQVLKIAEKCLSQTSACVVRRVHGAEHNQVPLRRKRGGAPYGV